MLTDVPHNRHDTVLPLPLEVRAEAIAVDAACSGNPGPMEYRGICLQTGRLLFHYGPVHGTNNIGEFLAIVHAMALMQRQGIRRTIYSDSRTAIIWAQKGKAKTTLAATSQTAPLLAMLHRAEGWLATHRTFAASIPLVKWDTDRWGEIPADFGRK